MKKHLPILAVLAIALVLRLIGLQSRPIWYDEAFSILLAEKGPAAILNGTLTADSNSSAAEEHPPAYYFTLWGWVQIFGSSLVSARLLSLLLSLGSIYFTYQIAEHLFDPLTAWGAALLTAIFPFQIHYAVEIRMYMMLAFWLTLATYAFLKRRWILFSLAAALAQYTHNLAAIYLFPLALTPLFQRDWKTLRALILAGLGSITLYSPWLIQLPSQISKVTSNFWIEKPGIEKIFTLLLMYVPHLPLPDTMLPFGLLFSMLVVVLAGFQTYRAVKGNKETWANGLWLAYLSFTPSFFMWLVSQISPIYVERALLPAHIIFCIWLAWVFAQTKLPRPIQIFASAIILVSTGIGLYQHVAYNKFPYVSPALLKHIQTQFEDGDIIVHSSKLSYLPSYYFDRNLPQGFILDPVNSNVDTLSPATRSILGLTSYTDIKSGTEQANRVWFIIYKQSIEEFEQAGKAHPDLAYLDQNFTLETTSEWNGLLIYIYRSRQ